MRLFVKASLPADTRFYAVCFYFPETQMSLWSFTKTILSQLMTFLSMEVTVWDDDVHILE